MATGGWGQCDWQLLGCKVLNQQRSLRIQILKCCCYSVSYSAKMFIQYIAAGCALIRMVCDFTQVLSLISGAHNAFVIILSFFVTVSFYLMATWHRSLNFKMIIDTVDFSEVVLHALPVSGVSQEMAETQMLLVFGSVCHTLPHTDTVVFPTLQRICKIWLKLISWRVTQTMTTGLLA